MQDGHGLGRKPSKQTKPITIQWLIMHRENWKNFVLCNIEFAIKKDYFNLTSVVSHFDASSKCSKPMLSCWPKNIRCSRITKGVDHISDVTQLTSQGKPLILNSF